MEEESGALQRATELRSYRMQGINDVVLPANFGISLSQEPADSPLKAVANTVRLIYPALATQCTRRVPDIRVGMHGQLFTRHMGIPT